MLFDAKVRKLPNEMWSVQITLSRLELILKKDRATVDAFYEAAIAAGGKDNGKPGLRTHYHANYYGAFVLDPAGNNIEAVCHEVQ